MVRSLTEALNFFHIVSLIRPTVTLKLFHTMTGLLPDGAPRAVGSV